MLRLSHILATSVATISLAAAAALPAAASPTPPPAPAPTTQAAPAHPRAQAPAGKKIYSFTTKGNVGEKITVTSKVWKKAGQKKGHLDWRAAKKYFGKHTTWRDDFAAGAQGGGANLDHASKATKKRLKKRWDAMGSSPLRTTDSAQRGGGTNCTGTSKSVKWNGKRSENWYDSCDTNVLLRKWGACTGAMGFAAFAAPSYWATVPVIFGLICGQNILDIQTAQNNSSVHAIKYYNYRIERQNSKAEGQYYVRATLYSQ